MQIKFNLGFRLENEDGSIDREMKTEVYKDCHSSASVESTLSSLSVLCFEMGRNLEDLMEEFEYVRDKQRWNFAAEQ